MEGNVQNMMWNVREGGEGVLTIMIPAGLLRLWGEKAHQGQVEQGKGKGREGKGKKGNAGCPAEH